MTNDEMTALIDTRRDLMDRSDAGGAHPASKRAQEAAKVFAQWVAFDKAHPEVVAAMRSRRTVLSDDEIYAI